MATTPGSARRPRASFPYAQSSPTTPLAKYSERKPDLYSLSATHAFDWEAARGKRPPPFVSAIGNGSSETLRKRLARAAVEDGQGGEGAIPPPRKRIVRKKPWRQRLSELPSSTWEWLYDLATLSNLPLPPPQTMGCALGGALHLMHFITRYSIIRSGKPGEIGWEDMHREIHIIDGLEQNEPQSWFAWTTPITIILILSSLLNCLYLFIGFRSYHLHLRENLVDSPRAKMVRMDMTTAARDLSSRSAPTLIRRLAQSLGQRISSACRKVLFGETTGDDSTQKYPHNVQQLDIWEPDTLKLALFSIYSPAHALCWILFSSETWFWVLVLMPVISAQIYMLTQSYEGLLKDRQHLNSEVMHEYNEKFVYPRIIPVRKDACVMTHEAEVVSWRD